MVEDSERWDISVCGLNCSKCNIFQAYTKKDEDLQRKISRDIFGDDKHAITCGGCRGQLDIHWSPRCKMLSCAKERGHQYCFECNDFPCTVLKEFSSDGYSHHKRTVENMKKMKEIGIDSWIMDQKRKVQCLFCP